MRSVHVLHLAGITYSEDKMLQSRLHSYQDTQHYRISVKCAFATITLCIHSCLCVIPRCGAKTACQAVESAVFHTMHKTLVDQGSEAFATCVGMQLRAAADQPAQVLIPPER